MKCNSQQCKKQLLQKSEDIQTIADELTEEFSMYEETSQSFSEIFEVDIKEQIKIKQCDYNKNEKLFQQNQEPLRNYNVEGSLENLKIYIQKYKPKNIELDSKLKPFIPDYIPAINNVEDCIMIPRPDRKNDDYGVHDVREVSIKKQNDKIKINFNETQKEQENRIKQGLQKEKQRENQKHLEQKPTNQEDIFKIISQYQPITINIEPILKPFIPDYIPQVQNPDAILKVPRPDGKEDFLGLTMLDERKVKGLYTQ
ncbi:unnamed protein product [Paramecium sonneborni]|uniref:Uncharacterized protein n=1 Tax=Paramecium sonneborni TaxID=65129 RepID=A0A8S1QV96_9CILI|nr:unnamed protein product [Paramecium sonneborni]